MRGGHRPHLDAAVEGLRDSDRVAEVVSIQRVEGE